MNRPFLSVVIPCFNEEKRLGESLGKMLAYLRGQNYAWEMIVVDDGSSDGTVKTAEEKLAGFPHRVLRNIYN